MKKNQLKVGIIGCGVISRIYAENITQLFDNLKLAACADLDVKRAETLAAEFGIPKACTVEQLLEDDEIKLVLNLTIPAAHAELSRRILESGKHVYSEKPLALSQEDAGGILRLAEQKGLLVGCAPDTVLGPGLQACRKILDEGRIGAPVAATANMATHGTETWHPEPGFYYQKGAGPLLDMGPYYLSALISLLGPASRVFSFGSRPFAWRETYRDLKPVGRIPVEVTTTYMGALEFENGLLAQLTMSFDLWRSNLPQLEIYGTEGTLVLPDPNTFGGRVYVLTKEKMFARDHLTTGNERRPALWMEEYDEQAVRSPYPKENLRGLGVWDMADALLHGREHRLSHAHTAHVSEVMFGLEQSMQSGKVIEISGTCLRLEPMPDKETAERAGES